MILKALEFLGLIFIVLIGGFALIYTVIYMVKEIIELCRK